MDWRKLVQDGDNGGIKAKTVCRPVPAVEWNKLFALIWANLLVAKSIGVLATNPQFADELSPPQRASVATHRRAL